MSAGARREVVLAAATRAFARSGYAGTSTDAVAREAGVSQPYVVRIFGTKLELFLAVFERACEQIRSGFEDIIGVGFDPESEDDERRLGRSYLELIEDDQLLRVMMHGFNSGQPDIERAGRNGMSRIVETLHATGWDDAKVRAFIAQGMLLNVLLSLGALDDSVDLDELGPLGDLVRSCLPPEEPR